MEDLKVHERRTHRRLDLRLPLEYRKTDAVRGALSHSTTRNVSTGGLFFETMAEDIRRGDLIDLHLGVPASDDRFPPHGKIVTVGEVVRKSLVSQADGNAAGGVARYGVAARFKQGLKLTF